MREAPETLYIRLHKRVRIGRHEQITLGTIADMAGPTESLPALRQLYLMKPGEKDGNLVLIDMMLIIERIKQQHPALMIEHFGEPHTLVEVYTEVKRPSFVFVVVVWLLLFIGSGLAIMNFHADVSMAAVHRRLYQLLTGRSNEHPLLLQIPYSIGIGIGMVVFFNHLFKKKFNEEPSPLEVEMYLYQENMHQYVVSSEYSKLQDKKES